MRDQNFLARADDTITGGILSQRRDLDPPRCFIAAHGSRVMDSDGKEYVDFNNGYGTGIIGHGDLEFAEAVKKGLLTVDLLGLGVTPPQITLAETLVRHVPSMEQVLLCNSGSEATQHAVRLARAATGREGVIVFRGCFHGTHDHLITNPQSRPGRPPAPGTLRAALAKTHICRYNDLASVDQVLAEHGDDIAAIVLEPYAHNICGAAPAPGFLEGLRHRTTRHGIVLVFDEVITGIRCGLGGHQATSGVIPDLTTLAKALGNGEPIGAIGGRRDLMEHFNTSAVGDVVYSGTFNGSGGPVAAALHTIERLQAPGAYEHMAAISLQMQHGLTDVFSALGVQVHMSGHAGIFHTFFGEGPITCQDDIARNDVPMYERYRAFALTNGVLDSPETQCMRSHVTLAHTTADVERSLEAAEKSARQAKADLRR